MVSIASPRGIKFSQAVPSTPTNNHIHPRGTGMPLSMPSKNDCAVPATDKSDDMLLEEDEEDADLSTLMEGLSTDGGYPHGSLKYRRPMF
ncbi:MAG TPA: hypothetical protein VGO47_02370 [Chlamydiales bacterium]|nr:hypothetical protein [Chlamydiales bacterium]